MPNRDETLKTGPTTPSGQMLGSTFLTLPGTEERDAVLAELKANFGKFAENIYCGTTRPVIIISDVPVEDIAAMQKLVGERGKWHGDFRFDPSAAEKFAAPHPTEGKTWGELGLPPHGCMADHDPHEQG